MEGERFIGLQDVQNFINRMPNLNKAVIKSTFLEDTKEIKKDQHKNFSDEIVDKIFSFSKKFPHSQFAVVAREDKITRQVEIQVKPIHGTA